MWTSQLKLLWISKPGIRKYFNFIDWYYDSLFAIIIQIYISSGISICIQALTWVIYESLLSRILKTYTPLIRLLSVRVRELLLKAKSQSLSSSTQDSPYILPSSDRMILRRPHGGYIASASWKLCSMSGLQTPSASAADKSWGRHRV